MFNVDPEIQKIYNFLENNFNSFIKAINYVYLSIDDDELDSDSYVYKMKTEPESFVLDIAPTYNNGNCHLVLSVDMVSIRYDIKYIRQSIIEITKDTIYFYHDYGHKKPLLRRKKISVLQLIRRTKINNIKNILSINEQ